jgi:hypothetical protein
MDHINISWSLNIVTCGVLSKVCYFEQNLSATKALRGVSMATRFLGGHRFAHRGPKSPTAAVSSRKIYATTNGRCAAYGLWSARGLISITPVGAKWSVFLVMT